MIDEPSENAAVLRLKSIRNSLKPAERRVAEYIIENSEQVLYQTVNKIATSSGVSEATVIRLCRSAGYSGFNDLRIQLAQMGGGPVSRIQRDLVVGDTSSTILEKVFRANVLALVNSLETIDRDEFEQAVDAVCAAKRVLFMGVGTSGTVAMDAVQKFLVTGVQVASYSDIVLQALSASTCSPDDVVIGLSQSGATHAVVSALQLAASRGATVIAITSNNNSPFTKVASITLLVSMTDLSFQSTTNQIRTAQLSVIDALCISVAMRNQELFVENSERMEEAARRLHTRE